MNLRKAVTRKITYTIVKVEYEFTKEEYIVIGETDSVKELKKILNKNKNTSYIPKVECKVVSEKRAMTIQNFIKNSILINESEEK